MKNKRYEVHITSPGSYIRDCKQQSGNWYKGPEEYEHSLSYDSIAELVESMSTNEKLNYLLVLNGMESEIEFEVV